MNFVRVIPLTRLVVVAGRDRHKSPFVSLSRLDPRSSRSPELVTCSGRELKIAWGGWSCRPQINRYGAAFGRLWIEWC